MLAVWALLGATAAYAQETNLVEAVDAFYPTDRLKPADASERRTCAQAVGPVVVAGFADRTEGVVRVLRRTGTGALEGAFDSPPAWAMPGTQRRCTVRLNDLDGDGQPEVFVAFDGQRASFVWVFRWDGSRLVNLTPTQVAKGRETTLLLNAAVYDLEHRGGLRVVAARDFAAPPPGVPAPTPAYVYRLGASGLEVEASLLAIMGFRADVNPASNLRSFRVVTDSSAPYTLRVINGDRTGAKRVAGATVTVNNAPVLGPDQIHAGSATVTATMPSLLVQNHVTATLTGAPDAYILVLVQDSTPRER